MYKGNVIARVWIVLGLLATLLTASGCGSRVRPAPTRPAPTPTVDITTLAEPDIARGATAWKEMHCDACHGEEALGGVGPKLAQTDLPFSEFLDIVRHALPPKPAFSEEELSTQDVYNIYAWLQTLQPVGRPKERPPLKIVRVKPGQEELPDEPILGISLWTGFHCDECHGAFAQGTSKGPALQDYSYPFEVMRANMRRTASEIPEHAQEYMRDTVLQRLYKWLREGAHPEGGC